jgi:ketosteroid isomerase-like protein
VSQENVEIVRVMYDAFNRGDAETALKLLHPNPELHQPPEIVDAAVYVGLDAFLKGLALFTDEFEKPRFQLLETEQVADGVVMRVRVSGRGKSSGIAMTMEYFHAWTVRDGRACRCFVRSTREQAVEAAGLAE